MSMLFSTPKAPAPPPPPPSAPQLSQASIAEQGAAQQQALASASGAGFGGNDKTGGQGAANPNTTAQPTKTLLGG
jgi:hypothetical protein